MLFDLQSEYTLAGDQTQAVENLIANYQQGDRLQTLHGATGTGKTFTMANLIQHIDKPTLILSHNKTLAAQLATECKHFFPNNAVHYFISYFDYYQPESYLPTQDVYIEKESTINAEIQMYRLGTLASLLTRKDVIVVASVSSLYGLGKKEFFKDLSLLVHVGQRYNFQDLKQQLLKMQYQPVKSNIEQGMFDMQGERVDVYSSVEKIVYRLYFNEETLEMIEKRDGLTYKSLGMVDKVVFRPATQFLQDHDDVEKILQNIQQELAHRVREFEKEHKIVEAQRLQKKVGYDIRMIRETGFTNGIENYSPYFDKRSKGEPPNTLFDYFGDDFLCIVDESHMTLPQLQAMPSADRQRKINLIDHGFRLPSAIDHRPLTFTELTQKMGRDLPQDYQEKIKQKTVASQADVYRDVGEKDGDTDKKNTPSSSPQTLFVSATPSFYERDMSEHIVEQIIRPTGLLDPLTYVYPKSGNYDELLESIHLLLQKKPRLKKYFLEDT